MPSHIKYLRIVGTLVIR